MKPRRMHLLTLGVSVIALASTAQAGTLLSPTPQDRAICAQVASAMERQKSGAPLPDRMTTASLPDGELQACSYDGKAFRINASALTKADADGAGGADVVGAIMRHTGLPQNFKVVEGEVPNAAALIVIGPDRVPERIIAYNPDFIRRVSAATDASDWAGVSIMAHEVAHHLSGHTLTPGGSQPPTELEADKFSGFVLFRMGASLDDARRAISTMVGEADSATHPGRAKRLAAVDNGWTQSCAQRSGTCDAGATAAAAPEVAMKVEAASRSAPPVMPGLTRAAPAAPSAAEPAGNGFAATVLDAVPADAILATLTAGELDALLIATMGRLAEPGADAAAIAAGIERINAASAALHGIDAGPGAPKLAAVAAKDQVPDPDPDAIPLKADRFVFDAMGILDPATKAEMETAAFDFAAAHGVEIVTIVADSLHGLSADDYARAMMRQLRVGQMDVGSGAVIVAAPNEKVSGVALGSGMLARFDAAALAQIRRYPEHFIDSINSGATPSAPAVSRQAGEAALRLMRDTDDLDWSVRFQSLDAMAEADAAYDAERAATGAPYDPGKSPTWRKLVRLEVSVVTRRPDATALHVSPISEQWVGPATQVRTAEGRDVVVYVSANVEAQMTAALEDGKRYAMIMRETALGMDAPQFDLVSYDLLN